MAVPKDEDLRTAHLWSGPLFSEKFLVRGRRKDEDSMQTNRHLFTSESVTEGHPDKVCDQISDAILDAILEKDPMAHVACEVTATTGMVHVMGEISTAMSSRKSATIRRMPASTARPAAC